MVAVEFLKLSEIDNVKSTAAVQFDVNLFWRDPRLAELNRRTEGGLNDNDIPEGLWRPSFDLNQRCADIPVSVFADPAAPSVEVELANPEDGLLQLVIPVTGTVDNPMDLTEFPFDEDGIDFTLCGTMLRDGRSADASDFELVPCDPHKSLGFPFMTMSETADSMPEFSILGSEVEAYHKTRKNAHRSNGGYSRTWSYINFTVHVRREVGYFFWKIIVPLWLIATLVMSTFSHPACAYGDRTEGVLALFMATAATLYVVGASLPAASFLTPIDKLVVATLLLIVLIQLETMYLAKLCQNDGEKQAQEIDDYAVYVFALTYTLFNAAIFVPRVLRRWRAGLKPVSFLPGWEAGANKHTVRSGCCSRRRTAAPTGSSSSNQAKEAPKKSSEAVYVAWEDISKIDHGSAEDIIIGSARKRTAPANKATLIDTNGDEIYDAVDVDGDGVADATLDYTGAQSTGPRGGGGGTKAPDSIEIELPSVAGGGEGSVKNPLGPRGL
jgi:hypothetical protein